MVQILNNPDSQKLNQESDAHEAFRFSKAVRFAGKVATVGAGLMVAPDIVKLATLRLGAMDAFYDSLAVLIPVGVVIAGEIVARNAEEATAANHLDNRVGL